MPFMTLGEKNYFEEKKVSDCLVRNLGASLGYVAVVEEFTNLTMEQSFEVVERAHDVLGWAPQYHIDSHHLPVELAHVNLEDLPEDQLIEAMLKTDLGCGFAGYHYGDRAASYIQLAKNHQWRVQLLIGEHTEAAASINYLTGKTFNTTKAVENSDRIAAFNQDQGDVDACLMKFK